MDAVEFLNAYKLMCDHFNCQKSCPIYKLLEKNAIDGVIDYCDDMFIYSHPEEVVEAVQEWSERKL